MFQDLSASFAQRDADLCWSKGKCSREKEHTGRGCTHETNLAHHTIPSLLLYRRRKVQWSQQAMDQTLSQEIRHTLKLSLNSCSRPQWKEWWCRESHISRKHKTSIWGDCKGRLNPLSDLRIMCMWFLSIRLPLRSFELFMFFCFLIHKWHLKDWSFGHDFQVNAVVVFTNWECWLVRNRFAKTFWCELF